MGHRKTMTRDTRAQLARETVAICHNGSYTLPDGRVVDISPLLHACLSGTRFFAPDQLKKLRREVLAATTDGPPAAVEVRNETTLAGIARVLADGARQVAALNFASARNPGGGFLNGSQAQEESLARSSALYASLMQAPEYYQRHRAGSSALYTDAMILSPDCPVFRADDGRLLDEPHVVGFITSPAPNAGAVATNAPEELPQIPDVLRRRTELVLALAAAHGYSTLVLGAWGCGVFRNDSEAVAGVFADLLGPGGWGRRFRRVVFSVLDTSAAGATIGAFERAFAAVGGESR
jgi:uncharacterized protein (TIGR02452 family)